MAYTLYKARGMSVKLPPCAICVDRTRGRTEKVVLTYGVHIWLCREHADPAFRTRRGGRDFVNTLQRLWEAHGCLTASRRKALDGYLVAVQPRPVRPRPGSYAWPRLREAAERLFAANQPTAHVVSRIRATRTAAAEPPSPRTIYRWRHERRWLARGSPP
jgi:hypothetical protein